MNTIDANWKAFLLRALVLGLVIFVAVRTAVARPGVPGGSARSFITIAGTVTGVPAGMTTMRFTFRRTVSVDGGMREERCVRDVDVPVDAAGTFAAEVPLDVPAPECVESFFDGSDVRVDVSIGGVTVVDGGAVNPVPYALHANTAAMAAPDSGLARQVATATTSAPPGAISAYGGATVPEGWLLCDGRTVLRSEYPALFAAIGTAWGAGNGSTTFHLPDLRGRFLRGTDTTPVPVDLDRATRRALYVGGNTGPLVGSYQDPQLQAHDHTIRASVSLYASTGTPIVGHREDVPFGGARTSSAGGSETRPVNAAVHYLIRY